MFTSPRAAVVLVLACLGGLFGAAAGATTPVDVELVLAADTSGSMDESEFTLQRIGYAQALRDPRVLNAIRGGPEQAIAVTFVEWTGRALQVIVVDWTVITDAESAERFAEQLLAKPRGLYGGGTAVGEAIYFAATLFDENDFDSERKVIDVSGDGPVNQGRPAALARDFAASRGITVNGLPILTDYPGLDVYYENNVIGGPGAFSVPAAAFPDFAEAVLHKLIREIAGAQRPTDVAATSR